MTHRKPPEADLPEEIRWQGNWIVAKQRGKWEYAGRSRGIRAAAILAIEDGHVLLVEQYRVPLGRRCIEIPAAEYDTMLAEAIRQPRSFHDG